jgi:hypothetical protein
MSRNAQGLFPMENGHPLSVILQNQAAQGQTQVPTLSQPHAQGQVANQQAAVNQQAVYQTRHLQSGSHQSPFQTNQQGSNILAKFKQDCYIFHDIFREFQYTICFSIWLL